MTPNKMERQILLDLLQLYKNLPYLWDPTHRLYTHKEARDRGWALLLGKFQLLEEDASLDAVKKKIDNMRTTYRREHKKVIDAQLRGDDYKPHLWYYHILSFLHTETDGRVFKSEADGSYQEYEELDEVMLRNENEDNSLSDNEMPPAKKKRKKPSSIYVQEHNMQDEDIGNISNLCATDTSYSIHSKKEQEEEVFGRTIGLQLKELNHMQKFIAEKLISEVIFHGRLGQLNMDSTVTINKEMQDSQ